MKPKLIKLPDAVETRAVDVLVPYARNARTHSDAQVAQIAASIVEFGWTNPVLISGDNTIIAGHGRVLAARKLGMVEVPCIVLDHLTETQRRALIIADNKLALNAGWDDDMLAVEVQSLKDDGFELPTLGFGDDEIAALLSPPIAGMVDPDGEPSDAPNAGVAVTVVGDVWRLGRHRLLCGSSTIVDDVDKVLENGRADLCLTDPPYGLGAGKASGKNDYAEYDDTRDNLIALAADWLPLARSLCDAVVFSPGVTNQWIYPEPSWVLCWFYGGGQLRSSWGFNCWQPFLCYGKDPSLASNHGGRPDAVNLNTPANASDVDHPCPKPVKLWQWLLDRLVFKQSAVVFEPFSGSGTAFIAAELKGGVSVRGIELSPKYVDIAVRRWQEFTGKAATLDGDGRTFAEVSAARGAP